ncbi:uncharacterized protein LOC134214217 [Armigeres subalbatus]|uniref:uncharacterized protein LOC134214217 n=1 Tax=Armigeres subalbatus TaxID=124917 RepID=UPI002ECFBE0D
MKLLVIALVVVVSYVVVADPWRGYRRGCGPPPPPPQQPINVTQLLQDIWQTITSAINQAQNSTALGSAANSTASGSSNSSSAANSTSEGR